MSRLESFFRENIGGGGVVKLKVNSVSYSSPESAESFSRLGVSGVLDLVDGGRVMVFNNLEVRAADRGKNYEYVIGVLAEYMGKRISLDGVSVGKEILSFYAGDYSKTNSIRWAFRCNLPVLSDGES